MSDSEVHAELAQALSSIRTELISGLSGIKHSCSALNYLNASHNSEDVAKDANFLLKELDQLTYDLLKTTELSFKENPVVAYQRLNNWIEIRKEELNECQP